MSSDSRFAGNTSIFISYPETGVAGDRSSVTLSRNVADGTKNRLPVIGRLKSSRRS